MRHGRLAASAVLLASLSLPAIGAPSLALRCGALFDAKEGRLLGPHVVEIDGATIASVTPGADTDVADVVDLSAQTCTPGWIDLHTHMTFQFDGKAVETLVRTDPAESALRGAGFAKRTLRTGFTTVRDLGDIDGASIALRDAIQAGEVDGPRMFVAGRALGATGGHGDLTNGLAHRFAHGGDVGDGIVDSPDDAVRAVRQRYKEGADWIKVIVTGGVLSLERDAGAAHLRASELDAIVRTAHARGMRVAAHAHGADGVAMAVKAGVDSIEHATFVDDATLAAMRRSGTWLVPTAVAARIVGDHVRGAPGFPEVVRRKAAEVGGRAREVVRRAKAAGVAIAFGSDAGAVPHGVNAGEFSELVAAGLTPAEALQAATVHAAALLGEQQRLGLLRAGYAADIVAVPGNPLEKIDLTRAPSFVMKGGQAVPTSSPAR